MMETDMQTDMLQKAPFKPSDHATTEWFGTKLARKVVITNCYPADINCQTGWLVDCIDQYNQPLNGLDSAWFRPDSEIPGSSGNIPGQRDLDL